MDKIILYKAIARAIVSDAAAMLPAEEDGIENQLIIDDERGHYLLFGVGWEREKRYFYATFIHIDVKANGRVWLQHDGTSLRIAEDMIQRGIPKTDIVIGFQSPAARKMMDFAEN